MNVRRDEINVTLNVFRDAVFLASDVGLASAGVRVLIVLCLQKIFGFIDSDISMQPVKTTRLLPRDCLTRSNAMPASSSHRTTDRMVISLGANASATSCAVQYFP